MQAATWAAFRNCCSEARRRRDWLGVYSGIAEVELLPQLRLQRLVAGLAAPSGTDARFGYDEDSARVPIPDCSDGQAPGRVEDFARPGDVNLAGTDLRRIIMCAAEFRLDRVQWTEILGLLVCFGC